MTYNLPRGIQVSPSKKAIYGDQTGGIDASLDEQVVESKFSVGMENVDLYLGGGFGSRRVVTSFTTDTPADPQVALKFAYTTLGLYEANDTAYVIGSTSDGKVRYVTNGPGASALLFDPGGLTVSPWHGCQINDKWYMQDGRLPPRVWDGIAVTTLGQTYNDDEAAPDDGDMPIADLISFYHGRCMIFRTREAGITYRNRVRVSHAVVQGHGEHDWKTNAKVDIEVGGDGEDITAIANNGQAMFVFKQHSIVQMTGFDPTDFSFNSLDETLGTVNENTTCVTTSTVYFWDQTRGLCEIVRTPYGSNSFWRVDDKPGNGILPYILSGKIDYTRNSEFAVGTDGVRVYCTVAWENAQTKVLVFDTRTGGWSMYDMNLGPYLMYRPAHGTSVLLAYDRNTAHYKRVVELGHQGDMDDWGNGPTPFSSYYKTAWLHDDLPHQKKRITFMTVMLESRAPLTVTVAANWNGGLSLGSVTIDPGAVDVEDFAFNTSGFPVALLERRNPAAALTARPDQVAAAGDAVFSSEHQYAVSVDVSLSQVKQSGVQAVQLTWFGPSGTKWVVNSYSLNYWLEMKLT